MESFAAIQAEINAITVEKRIMTVLTKAILHAADRLYKIGEEVVLYSEKEKKWLVPLIVVDLP